MILLPEPPGGVFDGPVHRFAVRAYFEDTDLSGVVYHANYLRWFERARSDMLRLLGIDQRAAHEAGEGAYAVSELTMQFLAPARLNDTVIIESTVEEAGAASCRILQCAYLPKTILPDGSVLNIQTMLTKARLRVGFVSPAGRPRRQPAAWRAAFAAIVLRPPEFSSMETE